MKFMSKIKRIYVAGAIRPYATEHPVEGYWSNIRRGIRAALEVLEAGFYPYCPFLDYSYYIFEPVNGLKVTEKLLKGQDFPWLEICDAVLVLPRYRKSEGTKAEIERARECKIPVFYNLDDLINHAEGDDGD